MALFEDNDETYGSKGKINILVGNLDMVGTHWENEVFRKIALIHFNDINLHNLVSTVLKKPFGITIIVP